MFEYGEAFLIANERALETLRSLMSPAAVAVAEQMAKEWMSEGDDA